MNIREGQFVTSKAGHDKGDLYIVCSVEEECVRVVNGTTRKHEIPKRKNIKHIQVINYVSDEYVKLAATAELTNEYVKNIINKYRKNIMLKGKED